MAESKISARDYILMADIDDNATFKVVACLTSNSLNQSLEALDGNSKCGNEQAPGEIFEASFDFEGFAIDETGTPAKDSYKQLNDAFVAKTVFPVRMQRADAAVGSIRYEADVWISELAVEAADGEYVTFSGTFMVKTAPVSATVIA
jgi:hypothetical protein